MALPAVGDVCVHAALAVDVQIRFPGGITLQVPAVGIPKIGEQVAKLLAQFNAAIAPFMPVLNVVDALLSAAKVFDAVKSLNPIKIGATLVDFLAIVDKLTALLPPVAFPAFIKDLVNVILLFVIDVQAQLTAVLAAQERIGVSTAKVAALTAAGELDLAAQLNVAVSCAALDVDIAVSAIQANAMPVNRIIGLVSLLCGILGLPELPSITVGVDVSASISALDVLVSALRVIEAGIPA